MEPTTPAQPTAPLVHGGDDPAFDPDLELDPGPAAVIAAGRPAAAGPLDAVPLEDGDADELGEAVPLDVLRAEVAAEVVEDDTALDVTTRPGYRVTFRKGFTGDELNAWRRRSTGRRARRGAAGADGFDELKFAALVLVNTCTGILRHGVPVLDDAGQPMTFTSTEWLDLFPAARGQTTQAVRLFYGRDAVLTATAEAVVVEAGWSDTLEDAGADPTPGR